MGDCSADQRNGNHQSKYVGDGRSPKQLGNDKAHPDTRTQCSENALGVLTDVGNVD